MLDQEEPTATACPSTGIAAEDGGAVPAAAGMDLRDPSQAADVADIVRSDASRSHDDNAALGLPHELPYFVNSLRDCNRLARHFESCDPYQFYEDLLSFKTPKI